MPASPSHDDMSCGGLDGHPGDWGGQTVEKPFHVLTEQRKVARHSTKTESP
jgi:hypothetical protein